MDLHDEKLSQIENSFRQACELIRAHTSPAEIRAIVENLQVEWIPALVAAEIEAEEGGDPAALFPELKLAVNAVYYCNSLVDMGGLVDAVEAEVDSIFGAAEGTVPIRRRARTGQHAAGAAAVEFTLEQKALLINILRRIDSDPWVDIDTLEELWGVAPKELDAQVVPIETYRAEEGQAPADLGGGGSASGAVDGAEGKGTE